MIIVPASSESDQFREQVRVADQGRCFDFKGPDRTGGQSHFQRLNHTTIAAPRQADKCFAPCIVVVIRQSLDEGGSDWWRVHVHLRAERERRPIPHVRVLVSRELDQSRKGMRIVEPHDRVDDGVTNGGIDVTSKSYRRNDRLNPVKMAQSSQNCSQHTRFSLGFEYLQQETNALSRECSIRRPELPENVGPELPFDGAKAVTQTEGAIERFLRAMPVQRGDRVPAENLVLCTESDRNQLVHGAFVVFRVRRAESRCQGEEDRLVDHPKTAGR